MFSTRSLISVISRLTVRTLAPSNIVPQTVVAQTRSFARKPFQYGAYDPKEIRALLEMVEERLVESEKEAYGKKHRGRGPIHAMLKREAPSKTRAKNVNLKTATVELKTLLYTRHALRHGAKTILELKPKELAKTFLGENCNMRMTTKEAKTIILEMWRHNRSGMMESFQRRHEKEEEEARMAAEKAAAKSALAKARAAYEDELREDELKRGAQDDYISCRRQSRGDTAA